MLKNLKSLIRGAYYPLNVITISKTNLLSNYKYLAQINKKIQIAPVLKSNAYGHGLIQIAKIIEKTDCSFICVDSLFEAYELKKQNIKKKILIMGYVDPKNLKIKNLPFSYAVYDITQLEALNKYQKNPEVHIKIDTGMHRLGISMENLDSFLKNAQQYKNVDVVGVMSHFAQANNPKSKITKTQIENFIKAKKKIENRYKKIKYFHVSASDGLINLSKEISDFSNLARVGLALYGLMDNAKLKPVLKLSSKIVQIKSVKKGEVVGYDATYRAKKDLKLAVLPIGYNDGVQRRLSNIGHVKIGNSYCPIIGRVSMNITTIDVTKLKNVKVGQEVIIYSNVTGNKNSIENTAKLIGTIPHELLTSLHPTAIHREVFT